MDVLFRLQSWRGALKITPEGREERPSHGKPTGSSFGAIRSCVPGSHNLGPARRVAPEEPAAECGVGIYVASNSVGAFQRREPDFERHITLMSVVKR
jgi:hypothetical protein